MSPAVAGEGALILPRRLAIALLAEAQKAGDAPVSGVIGARDGVPVALHPGVDAAAGAESLWAHYRSGAQEPDAGAGRQLLISIDLKGVLQLRCFERGARGAFERELRII